MQIGGVEVENTKLAAFDCRSPRIERTKTRSIGGLVETVPISITHRYTLRLQSLSRAKYTELYNKLVSLESTANGKITIDVTGVIFQGLTHIKEAEMPATLEFDFDISTISPTPNLYFDLNIPLEVYEAI